VVLIAGDLATDGPADRTATIHDGPDGARSGRHPRIERVVVMTKKRWTRSSGRTESTIRIDHRQAVIVDREVGGGEPMA
jgi:ribosomal protein L14